MVIGRLEMEDWEREVSGLDEGIEVERCRA